MGHCGNHRRAVTRPPVVTASAVTDQPYMAAAPPLHEDSRRPQGCQKQCLIERSDEFSSFVAGDFQAAERFRTEGRVRVLFPRRAVGY